MSEENPCPLLSLPDELLCHIFSLITDIPFKMKMESVCKRFQLISTKQAQSWGGNDTLDMNVNCRTNQYSTISVVQFKSDCTKHYNSDFTPIYLNGFKIALENWPQALSQFLKRTRVRNFCLHTDLVQTPVTLYDDLDFLQQSFSVIKEHWSRIKLKYIEFHRVSGMDVQCTDELFLWVVESSGKWITSVVMEFKKDEEIKKKSKGTSDQLWTQICSKLDLCPNLESFTIKPAANLPFNKMVQALAGKPLTSLSIGGRIQIFESEDVDTAPTKQAVLAICKASTALPGMRSLKIAFHILNLSRLSKALDSRTRQSLEEILIYHDNTEKPFPNSYLRQLDRLPYAFPNLKLLDLDLELNWRDRRLRDDLLFNTNFFLACNQTPNVDRKVLISYVSIDNVADFKGRLEASCRESEIEAVFPEKDGEIWARLIKGHGIIELQCVEQRDDDEAEG